MELGLSPLQSLGPLFEKKEKENKKDAFNSVTVCHINFRVNTASYSAVGQFIVGFPETPNENPQEMYQLRHLPFAPGISGRSVALASQTRHCRTEVIYNVSGIVSLNITF